MNGTYIGYEGHPGWTWNSFVGDTSPFYDPELNEINFTTYCERNGYEDIDVVYIILGYNGMSESFKTNFDLEYKHFVNAQILIDKIHEAYPNAIVRCLSEYIPSQLGGMGTNYGATGVWSDAYGMAVTALHYNAVLEEMCALDKYKDFVKYVDIAGQFDVENNMPSTQKPVNTRNPQTEYFQTNGVHPSANGYYQIGDAAYRSMIHDIHNYYQ